MSTRSVRSIYRVGMQPATQHCNKRRAKWIAAVSFVFSFSVLPHSLLAQTENSQLGRLKFVESQPREDLSGLNRLVLSSDDRFIYAAAWRGNVLAIYSRGEDGRLTHLTSMDNAMLKGAIKLQMNHDQSRLAVVCLRSNTILLFARDRQTGMLTPDGFARTNLVWPVSLNFSPDGRFLYVGDAGGGSTDPNAKSAIVAFSIGDGGRLSHVERVEHPNLIGMRDFLFDPTGKHCYANCSMSGCLYAFERNVETGKLQLLQIIKNDEGQGTLLQGLFSSWMSDDGKTLFTLAGRFVAESGLTVFQRLDSGQLEFVSELALSPEKFKGGNHLVVTRDQRLIIASGTTGNSLAVVAHDPHSHALNLLEIVSHTPECNLQGASGMVLDFNQQYLYVGAENGAAISTFNLSAQSE